MTLRLVIAPSAEPVTLAEVKADLRIDHTDDDARLERLITEARQSIDGPKTWFVRTLMTQTWEWSLDGFPTDELELPTSPVQSITNIKYDDTAGAEQTLSSDEYYLDSVSEKPWLIPVSGGWTPSTLDAVNTVRIRFVAGYATAAGVPGPIKSAIRLMVQEAYDGTDTKQRVADLLSQYRLFY